MICDFKDKVFILEGPDGSGKTTLGHKLADTYGIEYVHLTYYEDEESMRTQFYDVIRRLNMSKKGFVVDGDLGCFHVLATVNSASVNIWVHVSC